MADLTLYRPLSELQREVDRLFEEFFPTRFNDEPSVWSPAVDLYELADSYVVMMDLPGLSKKDIQITFDNGALQISGERSVTADENVQFHKIERRRGRFHRSLRFPREVQPEKVKASFEHGVLTIRMPKTERSRPRKIEIS